MNSVDALAMRRRAHKTKIEKLRISGAHRLGLETLESRCLLAFIAPVNYPIADVPQAIASGDFNGDGNLDLVTANAFTGHNLSVLMGKRDGTFQPPAIVDLPQNDYPTAVAVGDFNRDGKLDIIESHGTQIGVFLGNGDGTFAQPIFTATGASGKLAVGDFNGDGKLDVAVTDETAMDVNVLLGAGDGTFGAPVSYAVGKLPGSDIITGAGDRTDVIAVGDVNGDGKLDILTASRNVQDVSVLLGRGDGTFAASQEFAVDQAPAYDRLHDIMGGGPIAIAIGDLNGDGRIDVAVANQDAQTVSVLMGNGDGTLRPAVNYAVGGPTKDIAIGDFNRDGQPDLAVANGTANSVSVLYGRGDGTFQTPIKAATNPGPIAIVIGDFNHDGVLDLATANSFFGVGGVPTGHSVSVVLNVPTPNERFIDRVYSQLLGRPVDLEASAYWSSFLANGGSRNEMTLVIEGSLEYRADEVAAIYQKYLHRAPDAAGWKYFTDLLAAGGTVEQISATIVGSSEYMQGVIAPLAITPGQPPDDGFVEKLFRDALGRDVDSATLTAFDSLLANHFTHAQIATIVFHSEEYDRDLVESVFHQFLSRDPEPAALSAFTVDLLLGQIDEKSLTAEIVSSGEYYRQAGSP